jgi:hypothetical protein
MKPAERWLAAMWPLVRGFLPEPPAQVVELGCGSLGGFVPMLRTSGYEAVGVDPKAPEGASYRRVEFENAEPFARVDAIVASTSLHHVADPAEVLEWDRAAFDEPTAEWSFARLGSEPGWLHRLRDGWNDSGKSWGDYLHGWADEEGVHAGETLVGLLDDRFAREYLERGPYLFPDLAGTTEEDERAAIDAGTIRATRIDYVGTFA